MSITPDILNYDCTSLTDWNTTASTGSGTVTISDGFNFKSGATTDNNTQSIAGIFKTLSSVPNQFTFEIELYCDILGSILSYPNYISDSFEIVINKSNWYLGLYFTPSGLIIPNNSVLYPIVLSSAVLQEVLQIWRFQIDKTDESNATVEIFLNNISQGTFSCNKIIEDDSQLIRIAQQGIWTANRESHIQSIKMGTGLGEFENSGINYTLDLADSFILTDTAPGNQEGGNVNGFAPGLILDRLSIQPYTPTMVIGQSQQTGAIGYYNFNTTVNLTQLVAWVSSNPTVATIDSNGLIVAVSTGITFIRATYGSTSTYIMLKIEEASTVSTTTGSYTYQQISLTPDPNQTFSCTLLVDGKNIPINFQLRWNAQANYWVMTLINSANGTYYVDSIPLIAGVQPTINILQPYSYLKIGSCYIVNISGINNDYPTSENLGIDYIMLWGDTESV